MIKQKTSLEELQPTDATQEGNFPVPLTAEEFRRHVRKLFYLQMRTVSIMTSEKAAWCMAGKPPPGDDYSLFCSEEIPDDLGLTYDDIHHTEFVSCMESMYRYAYFGVIDDVVNGSINMMEYGSNFTLIASIARDMAMSQEIIYLDEGETLESAGHESAIKCYHFVEVANARCILENGRNFMDYDDSKEEDAPSYERTALSVPQMALLAGMGEMSIRAAANPKRNNHLKTYLDDGRTRIEISDAKAWLQAKNRYVPITRRSGRAVINLEKRKFLNLNDLLSVIYSRFSIFGTDDARQEQMKSLHSDFFTKYNIVELDKKTFSKNDLLRDLADLLEFPADLFILRVREVLAKDELTAIERELQHFTSSQN